MFVKFIIQSLYLTLDSFYWSEYVFWKMIKAILKVNKVQKSGLKSKNRIDRTSNINLIWFLSGMHWKLQFANIQMTLQIQFRMKICTGAIPEISGLFVFKIILGDVMQFRVFWRWYRHSYFLPLLYFSSFHVIQEKNC